ncbi:alpha/beta hydrolase [Thorsellia kenyensis]|uniref:Alpha/beta hydrolase n=1 Tax=Thorsellia kenyensis TaxID=1549888 RepID=A0ABV6C7V0_9GAMM
MFKQKQIVLILSILLSGACASKDNVLQSNVGSSYIEVIPSGELINGTVDSKLLYVNEADKKPWNYSVYLPANFSTGNEYPVIYMLHGAGGDFTDWPNKGYIVQKLDRLIAAKDLPPSIVVFPDGFTSYYIDGDKHQMQTAFINELIPHIQKNYPIIKNRQAHAIAGLSMGGYGASRFALLFPEYFASAVMLSPALWTVDSMPVSRKESFAKDRSDVYGNPFDDERLRKHQFDQIQLKDQTALPIHFYVSYGSADTITAPVDAENFVIWAKDNHYVVESQKYNGYGHSWDFWSTSIDDGLRFIGKKFNVSN